MTTVNLTSAFTRYNVKSENADGVVVLVNVPVISLKIERNSGEAIGTYELVYPNPRGHCKDLFNHFREQEIFLADVPNSTMYRVMKGQINRIDFNTVNVIKLEGRSLSGILTDKKLNDSFESKRVDYILCDETYGLIPLNFSDLTTWNAFTEEFDRFDYWDITKWDTQESWCEIVDGELEVTGDGASTRTIYGAEDYIYKTIQFKAKVSSASDTVRFGFKESTGTNYVMFELVSGDVNCICDNGDGEESSATTTVITQTDYNYYRIEWANDEIRYYVNGVLEVTHDASIPVSSLKPCFEIETSSSVLTLDYMKVVELMKKIDRYQCRYKFGMDVVNELCDIGTDSEEFVPFVDDEWDFNAVKRNVTDSGYDYGLRSSLYATKQKTAFKIQYTQESKDLYNTVIVRGGENTTEHDSGWQDQFVGDGVQTTFALGAKAVKELNLTQVNGVTKTEGTDFNVTYGKEHTIVEFTTAPANTHTVNFRYDTLTPILAKSSNTASQTTYNITREYIKEDESIQSIERANLLSKSLLAFFSDPRNVIKAVVFLNPNLELGKTVDIDAPDLNISNTTYEIISISHEMALGKWETTLTLANADIDTNNEIIKEILQRLKAVSNKGNTTETVLDSKEFEDDIKITDVLKYKLTSPEDSFLLGHEVNGRLEMGIILDSFDDATNWSSSDFALADDSGTTINGVSSMKLTYSGTGSKTLTTTQSLGDLSSYTGENSGTPSQGIIGLWVDVNSSGDFSTLKLRVGSSSSDYIECTGTERAGVQVDDYNYYVFDLDNPDSTEGTPDWTDTDYLRLEFTTVSGTIFYLDYLTISFGDIIGLNGLGDRHIDVTDYAVV